MACKLVPIPGTFDFEAPTGESVTFATADHIGTVLIVKAEYAGDQLVPEAQAIKEIPLTVADGQKTVKLVCVFSASISGRGELREVAGEDSQFLRDLPGNEPFQLFRIIGKRS